MSTRPLAVSCLLLLAAACAEAPTALTDVDTMPGASFTIGSDNGQGVQFTDNTFEFFELGSEAGGTLCRGDYVDFPATSDFTQIRPDGTSLERKHYATDPMRVLVDGVSYVGTGQIAMLITRNAAGGTVGLEWTATGRVFDPEGNARTALCKITAHNGKVVNRSVSVR